MRIKILTSNGRDIEDITTISIDGVDFHFNNEFYYPAIISLENEEYNVYSMEGDLDELTTYDLRWHKEFVNLLYSIPEAQKVLSEARLKMRDIIRQKQSELKRKKLKMDETLNEIKKKAWGCTGL